MDAAFLPCTPKAWDPVVLPPLMQCHPVPVLRGRKSLLRVAEGHHQLLLLKGSCALGVG